MAATPQTEEALMELAWSLAGKHLASIAREQGQTVPANLQKHKGWIGELIENALGATAGNAAEPDFKHLGIELKTLPIKANGQASESTHVCTIHLSDLIGQHWEDALLFKKLRSVLWVPIQADKTIPLADRCVGSPFLWHADDEAISLLRADWEELIEMLATGEQSQVSAHMGQVLQVRPKAANSHKLTASSSELGHTVQSLPRGFYLRTEFTNQLLRTYYHPSVT